MAVGSGGNYAEAAARALADRPELSALEVARRAMAVAAELCVYTNDVLTFETIPPALDAGGGGGAGGAAAATPSG